MIELPEGTTRDLVASDDLDSGAVSYVLADNADFDITYEFIDIASINGQAPAEAAFDAASGRRHERDRRLVDRHRRDGSGGRPHHAGS